MNTLEKFGFRALFSNTAFLLTCSGSMFDETGLPLCATLLIATPLENVA